LKVLDLFKTIGYSLVVEKLMMESSLT